MSGGSYDYLYSKTELDELYSMLNQLDDMFYALSGIKGGDAAATETLEIKQIIMHQAKRVKMMANRLSPVWHAVEWHESRDSSLEEVMEALRTYNGESEGE